jgi:hypothetical protein
LAFSGIGFFAHRMDQCRAPAASPLARAAGVLKWNDGAPQIGICRSRDLLLLVRNNQNRLPALLPAAPLAQRNAR